MNFNALSQIDGTVLLPGDPSYDTARTVWNAMVDRRPRLVVRAASAADVATTIRAARDKGLDLAVRCGGHSIVGHAVPEDGLMLDLTAMGGVRVDPATRRAWVQGGAMLGALDRESQKHGLATTAGNVSHTGVGGLTLGGGMGWLARQHGLSCDNVLSFEVVTADGRQVTASATENEDLFWGLRGGGGNFGVVTGFEFRLHETGTEALSVEIDFPAEQGVQVMRGWRDLNATASRQATFQAVIRRGVVTVGYVWIGDPEAGRALLPSIRSLGRPLAERIEDMTYVELQRRDDVDDEHAWRRYWKGHYFEDLSDDAIDAVLATDPGPTMPAVSLQAYGGAIADVPDDDTAFSQRRTAFELVAATKWSEPDEDADRIATSRAYAARVEPFASGAYVNALSDEGAAGVRRAYPPHKLTRLTALKDTWDPTNVFHHNANIAPSGGADIAPSAS